MRSTNDSLLLSQLFRLLLNGRHTVDIIWQADFHQAVSLFMTDQTSCEDSTVFLINSLVFSDLWLRNNSEHQGEARRTYVHHGTHFTNDFPLLFTLDANFMLVYYIVCDRDTLLQKIYRIWIQECCAVRRYQWHGQVTTSNSTCDM